MTLTELPQINVQKLQICINCLQTNHTFKGPVETLIPCVCVSVTKFYAERVSLYIPKAPIASGLVSKYCHYNHRYHQCYRQQYYCAIFRIHYLPNARC